MEDIKLTRQQQKALHVWFGLLADELNNDGKSMSVVLQKFVLDIPATKYSIKEMLWKPIMGAMLGKESTTELLKLKEIDQVCMVLTKFLGEEIQISVPPFPSFENQSYENITTPKSK